MPCSNTRRSAFEKRICPHLEASGLVGWEEWGKRQTGNGKGKHEVAGPV